MKTIGVIGTEDDEQSGLLLEKTREMGHKPEFIDLGSYKFRNHQPGKANSTTINAGIFCTYGSYDKDFYPTESDFSSPRSFAQKHENEIRRRIDIVRDIEKNAYVVCSPARALSSDKSSLFLLESEGIKVPKTIITDDPKVAKEEIRRLLEQQGSAVLKPSDGSLGMGVTLFRASEPNVNKRVNQVIDHFFSPCYNISTVLNEKYLVQEFIPNPKRKIRTLVIGNEPLAAAYYLCLDKDWKSANPSRYPRRTDYRKPCKMNDEVRKISTNVGEILKTDIAGIDIIEKVDSKGTVEDYFVCDVNSPSHWQGLIPISETDIRKRIIEYALEKSY